MKRLTLLLAALAALMPTLLSADTVVAIVDVTIFQADAYRHVAETGDLLVLVRYELPIADWQNATYMADATCDDANDFSDTCFTRLNQGVALQVFYSAAHDAAGVSQFSVRPVPRVGHGLSAVYLAAGHTVTWGAAAYETCIEGSSTTFNPVPHSCLTINWRDSTGINNTPAVMDENLVQMMLNIQSILDQPINTFVNADKITSTGSIFPREAFPSIQNVVPQSFFAGVEQAFEAFDPPTGPGSLETSTTGAATASAFYTNLDTATQEYFGISVRTLGAMGTMIIAISLAIGGMWATRDVSVSLLMAAMVVPVGWYLNFIDTAALWTAMAIVVIILGLWLWKKAPA